MDTQNFKNNGHNKFPVSTETLDLLQQQTKLVAELTRIMGVSSYILKNSTATEDGLVVIDNELMPLKGNPTLFVTVIETEESVTFNGETIENARTRRWAEYTSTSHGASSRTIAEVSLSNYGFKSLKELHAKVIKNQTQYSSPAGSVIDYDGVPTYGNIGYGWIPCVSVAGENAEWTESERDRQLQLFIDAYGENNITYEKIQPTANVGGYGFRITSVTVSNSRTTDIMSSGRTYNIPNLDEKITIGWKIWDMLSRTGQRKRFLSDGGTYNAYPMAKIMHVV